MEFFIALKEPTVILLISHWFPNVFHFVPLPPSAFITGIILQVPPVPVMPMASESLKNAWVSHRIPWPYAPKCCFCCFVVVFSHCLLLCDFSWVLDEYPKVLIFVVQRFFFAQTSFAPLLPVFVFNIICQELIVSHFHTLSLPIVLNTAFFSLSTLSCWTQQQLYWTLTKTVKPPGYLLCVRFCTRHFNIHFLI